MNASQNAKSVSSIEQQIQSIQLSQRARNQALRDAHVAEAFVEVFSWAGSKFSRPVAGGFAKPSLKY